MTTRERAAPRLETEAKRKGWNWIGTTAAAVAALPLVIVAAVMDAALRYRCDEDGDGFR